MATIGHKLTSKGQVTIPKKVREYLGLEAGDRVLFLRRGEGVVLQGIKETLLDLRGSVQPRRRPEDFDEVRQQVKRKFAEKAVHG